jgi:exopolyphosphatase/guanosine-5'-triphosphate,3'-diphosphate pyrophosphatase
MTERHLLADPPTQVQVAAARADVEDALDEVERSVDLTGVRTLVGLAGSVTTVGAEALGLSRYEPDGSTAASTTSTTCSRRAKGCCRPRGPSVPRVASCTPVGST